MVTLTDTFLSLIVDIEWEISRLAVSVNFSDDVTVPDVFLSERWSRKAVIVFCCPWWYRQGIVNEDKLGFRSCLI